jgi:uridine kinase
VVAPVIVGVAGGSGSGKTCIATLISQSRALQGVRVVSISSDSYYKGLLPGANAAENNWDHPAALDLELLAAHLQDLRAGRSIRVPKYSFVEHARMPDAAAHFVSAADTDVVIVDGIFVLHDEGVRTACDLTLFTVEDLDVCLARRLRRDIAERGRTIENVLIQYLRFVRPGCAWAAVARYPLPTHTHAYTACTASASPTLPPLNAHTPGRREFYCTLDEFS